MAGQRWKTALAVELVQRLDHLEHLALTGCTALGPAGLADFAGNLDAPMHQLVSLDLSRSSLQGESGGHSLRAIMHKAPCLLHLSVKGGADLASLQTLAADFPEGSMLQSLDLGSCGIEGSAGGQVVAALVLRVPCLQHLDLGGNVLLGAAGLASFNQWFKSSHTLSSLSLYDCGLYGSSGGQYIAQAINSFLALQTLDISNNHGLGTVGISSMQSALSSKAPPCRNLSLSSCALVGAVGAQTAGAICCTFQNLVHLDLSMNSALDNDGLITFAEHLVQETVLESLGLAACGLGGVAGGDAVAAIVHKARHLKALELNGNSLGAAGFLALAGNLHSAHSLRTVSLCGCGLDGVAGGHAAGCLVSVLCTGSQDKATRC